MNPRRSTHIPGSSTKIPWARIALGCATGVTIVGMTVWGLTIMSDPAPTPTSAPRSVNEDPWNGVPQCTDAIADAGGICHGEPVSERSETPTPTPTPTPINEPVRTKITDNPPPPLPVTPAAAPAVVVAPPVVETPPALVNEDAPRWANEWLAGVQPCAVEDDDNCYWDALTMGNGEGWSFVTVNGVTHYPVLRDPLTLNECVVEDDANCLYRGVANGDRCDWVNAPELMSTWFLNCDDDDLATKIIR